MRRLLALLLSLAAGVVLGLVATGLVLRGPAPFGAARSGPWAAWPEAGTGTADPYLRALAARDGRIPLAAAAGLRFYADGDDDGRRLDADCVYRVAGPTPPAQFWTLTVLDPNGHPHMTDDERAGLTSAELVRGADGVFAIALARQARPGNWLPLARPGGFRLMLSFYDTTLGAALRNGGPLPSLPSIAREACS